jgi:anti-anti-sigma factor
MAGEHDGPTQPESADGRDVTLAVYRAGVVDIEVAAKSTPDYAATVILRNEHDLATSQGIEAMLAPLVGNVLVDLSECDFMDSTVITVLLSKARELEREGYQLELVVPPENVHATRIAEVVGLRAFTTVHDRRPGR